MSGTPKLDDHMERVRMLLERQVALISSRELAGAVLQQMLERAGGSEADCARSADEYAAAFIEVMEDLASDGSPDALADMLIEVAAQAVSGTAASATVREAAYAVFGAGPPQLSEAAHHGRQLLQKAVLDNMHRLEYAEVKVFVALNGLPQPAYIRTAGR